MHQTKRHVDQSSADSNADDVVTPLVERLAKTAIARDRAGGTAKAERDALRASGLLKLTIGTEWGGGGATWTQTLAIVRRIARVDGSIAHLFGFHHLLLATARLFGDARQWQDLFQKTVRGDWFWGNALNPLDQRTAIRAAGDGTYRIAGNKTFCSGASDSDMLIVSALDVDRRLVVAAIPTTRTGIRIAGDWDNMGQRQTDSGGVAFDDVRVDEDEILKSPGPLGSVFASLRPCIAQLVLVNVYLGIGEGALEEARRFATEQSRPWHTSGVTDALEDPYVLHNFGEMWVALQGARALTDSAGLALDAAWKQGDDLKPDVRGACALEIAAAKVAATRAGLDVANRMFEVSGARATSMRADLDRFWRNLRTHTLHDPVDYKLRELGQWAARGDLPKPSFYS